MYEQEIKKLIYYPKVVSDIINGLIYRGGGGYLRVLANHNIL